MAVREADKETNRPLFEVTPVEEKMCQNVKEIHVV